VSTLDWWVLAIYVVVHLGVCAGSAWCFREARKLNADSKETLAGAHEVERRALELVAQAMRVSGPHA